MARLQVVRCGKVITSLLLAAAVLIGVLPAHQAFAHPPLQSEDQPGFVTATYAAPDGGASIKSQETTLTADHLASAGTLQGLELTGGRLTLAPGQNSGTLTSAIIESPLASTTDIVPVWDIEAPDGSEFRLETRIRGADGAWSDWVTNPEAFFPVRDNQHGGSLIWIGGGAAAIQFRATLSSSTGAIPALRSITLTFSNSQDGPDAATIAAQMDTSTAGGLTCPPPKPPVVPRTVWGCPDGENSPRRPPTYAPVTHVVIHHTATPNSPYQDWAQVVRSVWNYHANTLWWGDVGYNYLIDPNGVIYEGRAGGDDVVGIHDTVNQGSMAIGFIGCYGNCNYLGLNNAQPSSPMLNSGAALTAWKVAQKRLDPYAVTPYDGAGLLPTIAGGRDVTATYSPGDYLYDKLPWLRDTVAQYVNCGSTCRITDLVFDKDQYAPGDTIYLTVKLEDMYGAPLSGANVLATVTRVADSTAATSFNLADLTGYYQGSYSDTAVPGAYAFEIMASDPSGTRFAPCHASASAVVGGMPSGTVVKVEPEHLATSWCNFQVASSVSVYNAADVRRVYLELDYDPSVIQVVDADPFAWGTQVRLGGGLISRPTSVLRNEVDTEHGHIYFEATMLSEQNIQGSAGLIMIDWRPQLPGVTPVLITRAELANAYGQVSTPLAENGTVEIVPDCLMGTVLLQGRSDSSGVTITASDGAEAQTDAEGNFGMAGSGPITVFYPGYLSAAADPVNAAQMEEGSALGTVTLLAGDLNQDNLINIFDLAMIASQLDTQDPISDLNADGVVNILDVAMLAGNFGIQGPQKDWQ
jgi:hypothetical protein